MHIVTKFLVVLAAILSVLLSGLVVAYTFNYRTIKEDYVQLSSLNTALNTTIQEHAAVLNRQQLAASEAQAALQSELTALNSQTESLQSRIAELSRQNERLRVAEGAATARIDEFAGLLQTYAELDDRQSAELDTLRDRQLVSAQREIEYVDRINDLTAQLENATETSRSLQVQIAQLREQIETATSGGTAALAGQREGTRRAPIDFRGRILNVRRDDSGLVYASVDAGSSDQLAERMKLNIVRNGNFVATIVLQRVDMNEAVGLVDVLGRDVSVRSGDLVVPTL